MLKTGKNPVKNCKLLNKGLVEKKTVLILDYYVEKKVIAKY